MKRKKGFVLVLALLLSMTLLVACNGNVNQGAIGQDVIDQDEQNNDSLKLEKISITQPVQDCFWGPIYLAESLGYYEEAGLDVEFVTVNGDPGAPVFAGEAQFGLRGIEMPMTATVEGKGCKVLVSTMSKYPYTLMGASKEYSTIESLRGTMVAGSTPSGSPTAWVKACLAAYDMEVGADVEMTMLPGIGTSTALINGEVTSTYGGNAWLIKQMEENGCVTIIDGRDPAQFSQIIGSETYEMHILFASDEYIAANPEIVQKLVTACARAIDYWTSHTVEEISEALYPMFEGREEEVLTCVTDMVEKDMINKTGKHTESGYAAALKMAKLAGIIEEDLDASLIYDESFIDNAWGELGK